MGELSASIVYADFAHLGDQVKLVEPNADAIEVDVMDPRFVPVLSVGPVVVSSPRPPMDPAPHAALSLRAPATVAEEAV